MSVQKLAELLSVPETPNDDIMDWIEVGEGWTMFTSASLSPLIIEKLFHYLERS